ncbi:MAG TPA: hypothetical protein VHG91_06240 [Longimicrobium sp.]|nr:hypothetical protein [Longimicrobium sp.]
MAKNRSMPPAKGRGAPGKYVGTATRSTAGGQVASSDLRPAKSGRRKKFVLSAGLRKLEAAGGEAPRSFREGVERSLLDRATNLFRTSLRQMTTEQIQRAIAAPTPAATVVEVLNAAPEAGLARETATTRALARGAAAKQEMIQAAGGCLSSGEVAKLLGKTVSAVNQRRARNQILAVPLSGGEWGFPASQFSSEDLRGGIAEVVSAARAMSPWVLLSILLDRVPGSEARIIDSLDDPGVMEDVLSRVRSYGEHGAS